MSLPRITTRLTRQLSLRTPILLPNMNLASGPHLATAVAQTGALAFWALDARSSLTPLQQDLREARERLSVRAGEALPLGVGAIGWMLDQEPSPVRELLKYTLLTPPGVRAVWLSFGTDLGKWVRWVRGLDEQRGDGRKTLVFIQVGTVEQALEAHEWGVDAIVAQGSEAGGHSWAAAPSTSALLSQILAVLPEGEDRPFVLAAGGVGEGKHVAAYLTLGAEGVAVGTLLSAAEESTTLEDNKRALVAGKHGQELRTTLWDRVQGRPWPKGVTGGALRNELLKDEEEGRGVEEMRELMKTDAEKGEKGRVIVWAGAGVGSVKAIRPAKEIIEQLHQETVEALQAAHGLLDNA